MLLSSRKYPLHCKSASLIQTPSAGAQCAHDFCWLVAGASQIRQGVRAYNLGTFLKRPVNQGTERCLDLLLSGVLRYSRVFV